MLKPVVADSDVVAGQIGLWGGFAGQAAGVLLSVFSDHVGGSKRRILLLVRAPGCHGGASCRVRGGAGQRSCRTLFTHTSAGGDDEIAKM
eukprot:COSAG01_NODE_5780_length_4036_cov_27.009906_3_plen_90_part_00